MPDYPCPNFKQSHPLYAAVVNLIPDGDILTMRSGLVVGWESTELDGSEMLPHVLITDIHGSTGEPPMRTESPITVRARCEVSSRWFFAPSQKEALAQARAFCSEHEWVRFSFSPAPAGAPEVDPFATHADPSWESRAAIRRAHRAAWDYRVKTDKCLCSGPEAAGTCDHVWRECCQEWCTDNGGRIVGCEHPGAFYLEDLPHPEGRTFSPRPADPFAT